jgi:hypothetical protein
VTERINVLTKSLTSLNDDVVATSTEDPSNNEENITCEAHYLMTCGTCGQVLTENNRILREIEIKNEMKILKIELIEAQKVCKFVYTFSNLYTISIYIYV